MLPKSEVVDAYEILYGNFEITEENKEDFEYACETLNAFIDEVYNKENAVKPFDESKQDKLCPKCGAGIIFDALNDPIEEAPKYCRNCGQKFDWSHLK